jgi:hypothetical protein
MASDNDAGKLAVAVFRSLLDGRAGAAAQLPRRPSAYHRPASPYFFPTHPSAPPPFLNPQVNTQVPHLVLLLMKGGIVCGNAETTAWHQAGALIRRRGRARTQPQLARVSHASSAPRPPLSSPTQAAVCVRTRRRRASTLFRRSC